MVRSLWLKNFVCVPTLREMWCECGCDYLDSRWIDWWFGPWMSDARMREELSILWWIFTFTAEEEYRPECFRAVSSLRLIPWRPRHGFVLMCDWHLLVVTSETTISWHYSPPKIYIEYLFPPICSRPQAPPSQIVSTPFSIERLDGVISVFILGITHHKPMMNQILLSIKKYWRPHFNKYQLK